MKRTLIVATTSYAGMGPYVSEIVNTFSPQEDVYFFFHDYEDDFSKTQNLLSLYGLDCNHFIATSLEEAKPIMEYIQSIPVEVQHEIIKRHNLKIINEYSEIMSKIMNVLECKDSVNNQFGGAS